MYFIDLHIHTTASDGSLTPEEVVKESLRLGLGAISITDHDTVDGVAPAIEAAENSPLRVIPGVEISSVWHGREIHILGYNFDHENPFLISTLNRMAQMRRERNENICLKLQKLGLDITTDELYRISGNSTITRNDISRLMISKGYVKDKAEAFTYYLGSDAPCFVPKFRMPAEDAYKLITYAGGVCSLAHPVQYRMDDDQYTELFMYLKAVGFRCIEVIHSDNGMHDENRFKQIASACGLLFTGGSDFHGRSKPDIHIGTGRGNIKVPGTFLYNIGLKE